MTAGYQAQVFVCVNSKGAEDKRHCGDKGGQAVLQAFRKKLGQLGMERSVTVSKTGCTSQHAINDSTQTAVIIYGPKPELGGVWYRVSEEDVDEILREHLQKGRVVERLLNPAICVNFNPAG